MNEFMKLLEELFKKTLEVFIEIRGREAVFAEGYCRIEKYSETEIRLASDSDRISVRGESLNLKHLSTERIAIVGRIEAVEFI